MQRSTTSAHPRERRSAHDLAVNQDGQPRDGAWVTELTGLINPDSWPEGIRLICRRERPHPGAQLELGTAVAP
jgi:hypothetical protein